MAGSSNEATSAAERRSDVFAEMAAKHGVSAQVHPLDDIFQFLFSNESFPSKDEAIRYYFDDGARSARQVSEVMSEVCKIENDSCRVLEFASGYGFVTRHLPTVMKDVTVSASDLRRSAVRFTQSTLGVPSVASPAVPEKLGLPSSYDVVFTLSFFSSLPKRTWARWLDALFEQVAPGGFMIFTAQGLLSRGYFPDAELDEDGFWFLSSNGQAKASDEDSGQSIVDPRFAIERIFSRPDRELVSYRQGAWWGHQDLYVIKKSE